MIPEIGVTYASEPQLRVLDFCLALSELSELLGRPPLNTGRGRRAEKSETQELPTRCRHADSFRILSWNSASQPPLFLLPYCCTSSCKYLTVN